MTMPAKHQPAGAFDHKKLAKAPDTDTHPLAPTRATEPTQLTQFSARVAPDLLRQVKITVAARETTLQAATAEAFQLWIDKNRS